jgi:AcrR family transcriptional regulator
VPRETLLAAAEALFADAEAPSTVSMDDIALAAGVGKGTLFRAFGSRDGLLDALFAARLEPLRAEIERAGSPVGPDAAAADRVLGILDLLLEFKLENPRLAAARELSGSELFAAPHYRWVHDLLRDLIGQTGAPADSAVYTAHLLLGGLRADLLAQVLASGTDREELRAEVRRAAQRLIG